VTHQSPNQWLARSGKLCMANPIPTTIPVFNNEFIVPLDFLLYLYLTKLSQKIITATPTRIAKIILKMLEISIALGINSKHIIEIINPAANSNIKLKNLFEVVLKLIPITPPIVVPIVPKNKLINVVFNNIFTL